jgi:3-deoxy-D-arabino-heptulosonate 7-phosphate (DAHP) synthase
MAKDVALAGVAAGCDGVMIETHYKREIALSDGPQSLTKVQYLDAVDKCLRLNAFMKELNE